ncbi:MAG: hypothetical protein ACI4SH_05705 [Candidatus Scatosoma sp.]
MEYPIITIQGNGGGIRVMDGFQLGRKKMSEKQTALLKKLRTTVYGAENIFRPFDESVDKGASGGNNTALLRGNCTAITWKDTVIPTTTD